MTFQFLIKIFHGWGLLFSIVLFWKCTFSPYITKEWLTMYRYIPKCFHSWLFMTSISYWSCRVKNSREQDDLFIHEQEKIEMHFVWVISLLIRSLWKIAPDMQLLLSADKYGTAVSIFFPCLVPQWILICLDMPVWHLLISQYIVPFHFLQ